MGGLEGFEFIICVLLDLFPLNVTCMKHQEKDESVILTNCKTNFIGTLIQRINVNVLYVKENVPYYVK